VGCGESPRRSPPDVQQGENTAQPGNRFTYDCRQICMLVQCDKFCLGRMT